MAPAIMSREFLDRAPRMRASSDPDTATAETVALMCEYANKSARDPVVQKAAAECCSRFRGGPLAAQSDTSPDAIARSCWWAAHLGIEFIHHDSMIRALWGEPDQQQLLISPDVLLRMRRPAGDCAIFTMLICALLKCRGVRYEIVTAAVDPQQPEVFSHVYARAVMPDGSRIPLDASHGQYPGWQVPAEHVTRKQVWDESGAPIPDQQPWGGLHGYTRRRGMSGCTADESGAMLCVPDAPDTAPGSYIAQATGTPAPSAPGFNWGNFVGGLTNQWTQIAGRVIAPQTVLQRGPNGQMLYTTPGSGAGSSMLSLDSGSGFTGSTMLWIGGGVLALVLVAKAFGGKK